MREGEVAGTPKAMRPGWGQQDAWAYPGVTAQDLERLAGYPVAAVPFVTPETITVDHGSVYKNHHLVEAHRVLGVNILPARVLRPTDKHTVERTFAGVQSLLFELLPGWQGIDAADRGVDPEADAVLTLALMEDLFATWILRAWQRRALSEYAPSWDPGGTHSPNSLFAVALLQGGSALQIPSADLYYALLPVSHVKIHGRRGVKVLGLWYDGPVLDPYRGGPSSRGGQHRGRWLVHYDRRNARHVFFSDPLDRSWAAGTSFDGGHAGRRRRSRVRRRQPRTPPTLGPPTRSSGLTNPVNVHGHRTGRRG